MRKKESKKLIFSFLVSVGDLALFTKNLSLMLRSGLSLSESIKTLEQGSRGVLKRCLGDVLNSINSGRSLANSLAIYPSVFSSAIVNIVKASELSGNLDEGLENISKQLYKTKDIISKTKGAMIYPIFVIFSTFILGLTIAFFVLPQITPLFVGLKIDLPASTRFLIWFSDLVKERGALLFVSIISFLLLFILLLTRRFMKVVNDFLLIKTPLIRRVFIDTNLESFCRTMGTFLRSGISIDDSLKNTKDVVKNYYYKKSIERLLEDVRTGKTISSSLEGHKKLYPLFLIKMIKVGEESGRLEEVFFHLADSFESDLDESIKTLSVMVEPILLLIIGLVVAFLAISIVTPIYKITGNIRR